MSDPDLGDRSQDREPPLVKSESSASGPPPAPGLIPLARPDTAASVMSAEKQQVSVRLSLGNSKQVTLSLGPGSHGYGSILLPEPAVAGGHGQGETPAAAAAAGRSSCRPLPAAGSGATGRASGPPRPRRAPQHSRDQLRARPRTSRRPRPAWPPYAWSRLCSSKPN